MPNRPKEKRVVLLVVEGKSDKVTLENAFRRSLMQRYPSCETKIHVIHGDGTLKRPYGSYIVSSEAIKATNDLVRAYLLKQKQNNGIKVRDILGIAQITDLDACFADSSRFQSSPCVDETTYDVANKLVLSPHGFDLADKREAKQQNLLRLNCCDHMTINKVETRIRFSISALIWNTPYMDWRIAPTKRRRVYRMNSTSNMAMVGNLSLSG